MDDLKFGTRDKRGNWRPNARLEVGPLFDMPWNPVRVLKWIPSYFLPWNALYFVIGAVFWVYLTPERATLQSFGWDWVILIYLRNAAVIAAIYGGLELRLYLRRAQGARFKYNVKFPADHPSNVFMFKSQTLDGIVHTFLSGVPIWTAYEVVVLWMWANGFGPWALVGESMWWLVCLGLCVPLIHEVHFYCIHRLIHIPILYKWIHSVHHNSINPSPWSSLSMHPIEHLLYWSDCLVHLIVPSHPFLVLYHLQLTGTGAVVGHIGFDKIETGQDKAIQSHAYAHYLHHKYFEVNYADGMLPFDKWMGTWHDGTEEGDQVMKDRFQRKKARQMGQSASDTKDSMQ